MIKIHNLKIITFNKIIIIIIMKKNQMVSNYVQFVVTDKDDGHFHATISLESTSEQGQTCKPLQEI